MSDARGWLWLVPVSLLVTGLLAAAATWTQSSGIESDLIARSQAALAAAGLPGAEVSLNGRDATLRGFPAGKAQQAADTVRRVDGVRVADVAASALVSTSETPATIGSEAPTPSPAPRVPTDKADLQNEIDKILDTGSITFIAGTDNLTAEGRHAVRWLAELIGKANVDAKIEVEGHVAQGPGGEKTAVKLSRDRAKAVANMLIDGGVPAGHITSTGFGDTRPNDDGEDRRVEIKVR